MLQYNITANDSEHIHLLCEEIARIFLNDFKLNNE